MKNTTDFSKNSFNMIFYSFFFRISLIRMDCHCSRTAPPRHGMAATWEQEQAEVGQEQGKVGQEIGAGGWNSVSRGCYSGLSSDYRAQSHKCATNFHICHMMSFSMEDPFKLGAGKDMNLQRDGLCIGGVGGGCYKQKYNVNFLILKLWLCYLSSSKPPHCWADCIRVTLHSNTCSHHYTDI